MGQLIKSATLVEFEPARVEVADLRIEGTDIVERGVGLSPQPGDEVIELPGRLVMPGLVSAHHHLSSMVLRGARRTEATFAAERAAFDALHRALSPGDIEAAARASALEGLMSGTTTVFDVQSPGAAVPGLLSRLAAGVGAVGLRAVLSVEPDGEDDEALGASLQEAQRFAAEATGRIRAALALGGIDRRSDDQLHALAGAAADLKTVVLGSLAEDRREEARCVERFGATPVERLQAAGLLGVNLVLAQGVHLSWPDLSQVIAEGTWMAHSARSNMASLAGGATPAKFGVHACLGTDTQRLDVVAEVQLAWLRARDSGLPIDALRFIANGHRLASQVFGQPVGPLEPGALADLVVLDYPAPTALTAETMAAHLVFGFSARAVESVMVDGLWRCWKGVPLAVDAHEVAQAALEASVRAWQSAAA